MIVRPSVAALKRCQANDINDPQPSARIHTMSRSAKILSTVIQRFSLALVAGIFMPIGSAVAQPVFNVDSALDQVDLDTSDGICQTLAGTCTLRAAVMQANRMTGAGVTIRLPPGTFSLVRPASGANGDDNGDLNLTPPTSGNTVITVTGAGPAATIIDANQIDRVLRIDLGRSAVIQQLSLRNGFVGNSNGGAINNAGILALFDTELRGNRAPAFVGGAVFSTGPMTMMRTEVADNRAQVAGGLYIAAFPEESFVSHSRIRGNIAQDFGGGIVIGLGKVSIGYSTLAGNTGGQSGGAIWNGGSTIVINSTLSGNSAAQGGGVTNASFGVMNVYNSTVVGNTATRIDGPLRFGGGIYNSGTFNLRNTLVAGNTSGETNVPNDCVGTLVPYGRNLFSTIDACTVAIGPGQINALNSLSHIGPLQSNGGWTPTHALLAGSNAIDGADPFGGCVDSNSVVIANDQRGMPRVSGVRCDVGAFEAGDGIFREGFE